MPGLFVDALDQINELCGASLQVELLEGEGHFSTFERNYRDPDFLRWLLRG